MIVFNTAILEWNRAERALLEIRDLFAALLLIAPAGAVSSGSAVISTKTGPAALAGGRSFLANRAVHEAVPASEGAALKIVLVVEDDPFIQEIVQEHLQEAGYDVVGAWDAAAAVAILEARQDIHLVFTDINMPGSMDGLKLAAAVRDRWPPVHIVVTSGGYRPPELAADAFFISKPYLGAAIIAAMRSFA